MSKSVDEVKQEIKEDIDELYQLFENYKKDGFTVTEIVRFAFEAGTKLIETVDVVKDISGAQKKKVVLSTVGDIYRKVNPDIPWIPEPFETMLENLVLDKVLDAFVDYTVKQKKGLSN